LKTQWLLNALKQSGPGFLQSACTIGGGTLGACLFLGSFVGLSALWVQPVAILLGFCVLMMISQVVLATGGNPLHEINRHVSPVLGWGWLAATVAANMVWGLPQYNLGTDALTQMVIPGVLGPGGMLGGDAGVMGRVIATALMAGCAAAVMLAQLRDGSGGRRFDRLIQVIVAGIVLCFGAAVVKLLATGGLSWSALAGAAVPTPSIFWSPAPGYMELISQSGSADFWTQHIVNLQRNTALAALSAAVGINMTFLMPYALLARGWGPDKIGLARFDLVIGLVIPFTLVTSFIVSASAATLHGPDHINEKLVEWSFVEPGSEAPAGLSAYKKSLDAYASHELPDWDPVDPYAQIVSLDQVPPAERRLAAATIKHGTASLAAPMRALFDGPIGVWVFGVGVFFIALSTVLIHMLINGYAMEAGFGIPRRYGSFLPLIAVLGPFFWGELSAFLVIPTSLIGLTLLPVALWAFLFLGCQKRLGKARLGPAMLTVGTLVTFLYTLLSAWAAYGQVGWLGPCLIVGLAVAAYLTSPLARKSQSRGV
jgi:Mn2+/Fe2+ NRAMP family transporter